MSLFCLCDGGLLWRRHYWIFCLLGGNRIFSLSYVRCSPNSERIYCFLWTNKISENDSFPTNLPHVYGIDRCISSFPCQLTLITLLSFPLMHLQNLRCTMWVTRHVVTSIIPISNPITYSLISRVSVSILS
jgi:hypothetical protein